MGNLSSKPPRDRVPSLEDACFTAQEYLIAHIKSHGNKVAQVDAVTGEEITFDVILQRAAALAAGLTARGLRQSETCVLIGENNIHYPWVLLGILQTGASAHLLDPRSTPHEIQHAMSISKPAIALVSSSVSRQKGVLSVLRKGPRTRHVLVWATGTKNVPGDVDLPDDINTLEQLIISPAKSASSLQCSPATNGTTPPPSLAEQVPEVTVRDIAPGLAATPVPPPSTPTSLSSTQSYGSCITDSQSPTRSTPPSPLKTLLRPSAGAVDGVPKIDYRDTLALVLSSSGSTGMPKGVMITHDNLLHALRLKNRFIRKDDVVAGISPYFHAYGGVLMLMSLCMGTPMVALGRFSMEGMLSAIEKYNITVIHVVSSLMVSLSKLPIEGMRGRLPSLRRIWSGAAQISPIVQNNVMTRIPHVVLGHSFGMTETTFTTFCGDSRSEKPGSPGRIVPGVECKIIDPDTGTEVAVSMCGELCFKGPLVTKGYLGNPEATAEAIDSDGWLHSGDVGFCDADGYYYIVERLKEILKYNGHQVSPSELEALLMTHPAVCEAAVFGEPHEYGDAPRALVVLAEGQSISEEELQSYVTDKVAPHKQLRGGITFVTTPLPRTASGKLQRRKLRAILHNDPDESLASSTTTEEATSSEATSPTPPTCCSPPSGPAAGSPPGTSELPQQQDDEAVGEDGASPPPVEFRPQYRPSVHSVHSLSTISERSSSVGSARNIDSAFETPALLREARQVPLPPSEPNSPVLVETVNSPGGSSPIQLAYHPQYDEVE